MNDNREKLSKPQTFTGIVEKVYARKPSGWTSVKIEFDESTSLKWAFMLYSGGRDAMNCTGVCRHKLCEGMHISFQCEYVDRSHKYGNSFVMSDDTVKILCDTQTSVVAYLTSFDGSYCSLISKANAAKLYRKYKSDVLNAIYTMSDKELSKYTPFASDFRLAVVENNLIDACLSIHSSLTQSICRKAIERFGKHAFDIIRADPYVLALQLGYNIRKTDNIAVELLHLEYNSPFRVNRIISYGFKKVCTDNDGSFVFLTDECIQNVFDIANSVLLTCEIYDEDADKYRLWALSDDCGIQNTAEERKKFYDMIQDNEMQTFDNLYLDISPDNIPIVYMKDMYDIECETAEYMADRVQKTVYHKRKDIDVLIDKYDAELRQQNERNGQAGWGLDDVQKQAVRTAFMNSVAIINGSAGTGKSTIIDCITYVSNHLSTGLPIMMTPTHKAKQRILECIKDETVKQTLLDSGQICTVAKFLLASSIDKPLFESAGRLIIIDECSMLPLWQADRLLMLLQEAWHIIFIGDYHQLPSIEPGCFFKDICSVSDIPRTELTTCYRSNGVAIVENSRRINDGNCELIFGPGDFEFYPYQYDKIADEYVRIINDCHDYTKICCLSPLKKDRVVGTEAINQKIQARLNPLMTSYPAVYNSTVYGDVDETEYSINNGYKGFSIVLQDAEKQYGLRIGDRIYATENKISSYNNGDTGYIAAVTFPIFSEKGIDHVDAKVHIELDNGRCIRVSLDDLRNDFILGYCLTIHKSQGSEYDHVLIAIPAYDPNGMMTRELVYTAVTRGIKDVKVYGSWDIWCAAIRKPPIHRNSLLAERIVSSMF